MAATSQRLSFNLLCAVLFLILALFLQPGGGQKKKEESWIPIQTSGLELEIRSVSARWSSGYMICEEKWCDR
ncbi:tumor suppressor candidate 3 [Tachysurus ichikawai]